MLRFYNNKLPVKSYKNIYQKRHFFNSFPNPDSNNPTPQDWFNFITTFTNCVVISSILWGFESYNAKLQMIEDTNYRIDELIMAYKLLERKCTKTTLINL
jgi:hypothetical protein